MDWGFGQKLLTRFKIWSLSPNKIVSLGLKTDFHCSPSLSHLDSLQPRSSGLQCHFWPHTSPPLVTSPLRHPFLPHHLATLWPLPSPFGNSPDNYLLFKVLCILLTCICLYLLQEKNVWPLYPLFQNKFSASSFFKQSECISRWSSRLRIVLVSYWNPLFI